MRHLYFIGLGSQNWRDPRNWSRQPDGKPLSHLHAKGEDFLHIEKGRGRNSLDLRGMPHNGMSITGFQGKVRLPDGAVLDLRSPVKRWWRPSWRRRVTPAIPAAIRNAVNARGWERTVREKLAHVVFIGGKLSLTPALSGAAVNRFWVGGSGTWNASNTANWASSTGGAGGASAPTSVDAVTFDSNSGTAATVTVAAGAVTSACTVNKSDITLTWSGTTTFGGTMTLTLGTINTNGQTVTWGQFSSNNNNTRTLTLGASNLTITTWSCNASGSNLTMTANTATINMSNGNLVCSSTVPFDFNGASLVFASAGSYTMTFGSPTCANLTMTGTAATTNALAVGTTTFTVTGTLTINGNSATNRIMVRSNSYGTQRTISAATLVCSNIDFRDISGTGAASWNLAAITGKSGDCGGNSGITFTTQATQTWSGTSGGNWSANAWTTRVPLPQDPVVINAAFSASQTITLDMPRAGAGIDFTGVSGSVIFAHASTWDVYGSLTYSATGMSVSGTGTLNLYGSGALTVNFNGVTETVAAIDFGGRTSYTISADFTASAAQLGIGLGTTYLNGKTVTAKNVTNGAASNGTFDMANGTLNLNGTGTVWTGTFLSVANTSGSTISLTDTTATAKTFTGAGLTYGTLKHTATGSAGLTISGSNTFFALDFECTTARTITFPASGTQTVTNAITLTGAVGQLLSLVSNSVGTATNIKRTSSTTITRTNYSASADVIFLVTLTTASIAATSTVSGSVPALRRVAPGTVSATSTASGSVRALRAIRPATVNATSTATGSVVALKNITPAQVSATSTLSGSVIANKRVTPTTISATSTASGRVVSLRAIRPATISATSTATGSVVALRRVAPAQVSATSAASGSAMALKHLTGGSMSATSTVSGAVIARKRVVAAQVSATSTAAGAVVALRVVRPATVAATSVATGTVTALRRIVAAQVSATSTAAGLAVALRRVYPAQVNATSTLSGSVQALRLVVPVQISATSSVTADVPALRAIAAAVNATSAAAGSVVATRPVVAGQVSATSTVTGRVVSLRAVATAAVTATSVISGDVTSRRRVAPADISATATVAGSVVAIRALLPAQISAMSTAAGTVTSLRAVAGQIEAAATVGGDTATLHAVSPVRISASSAVSASIHRLHAELLDPAAVFATATCSGTVAARKFSHPGVISAASSVTGLVGVRRPVGGLVSAASTMSGAVIALWPEQPPGVLISGVAGSAVGPRRGHIRGASRA